MSEFECGGMVGGAQVQPWSIEEHGEVSTPEFDPEKDLKGRMPNITDLCEGKGRLYGDEYNKRNLRRTVAEQFDDGQTFPTVS